MGLLLEHHYVFKNPYQHGFLIKEAKNKLASVSSLRLGLLFSFPIRYIKSPDWGAWLKY